MDEARVQQYMVLIQELLECPSGQEGAILQANGALVDEGFVQVAVAVAQQAAQQGENDIAQFLQQLVGQVAEALGLEITAPQGTDAARQFLLETFQLIVDKQGNPQQIGSSGFRVISFPNQRSRLIGVYESYRSS